MDKIFCEYRNSFGSMCGMYCPDKSGVCKKHLNKKPVNKVQKSNRFRGNSKFQKEVLGYRSNKEN